METNRKDLYQRHVAAADQAITRVRKSINTYSLLRLVTIVGGGAGLFAAVQSEQVWLVMLVFFAVLLFFTWLVWQQSKLEKQKAAWTDFKAVNQNELNVSAGKPNCYPDGSAFSDNAHPYSQDLDVFGAFSLFGRVNRCATIQGNGVLAAWFSAPSTADTIVQRQRTAREMADDLDWCQQFQVKLLFNLKEQEDFKQRFARYLDRDRLAFGNRYLRMYVKAAPWLMGLAIGLAFFAPAFTNIAVFLALAHLLAAIGYAPKVNRVAGKMGRAGRLLAAFAAAVKLIEAREWKSPIAESLARKLHFHHENKSASIAFDALAAILDRLDYRLNGLVGAVLNMVALWDFRQVFAVLDWRQQYGTETLTAFDVTAEFEALMSLGVFTHNHPRWSFPVILDAPAPTVEVANLSHPLIPANLAIANDYRMDNHRIALITGSNMAGKSTFLRTIGSNAVLAFCGAPICGTRMHTSVFQLATYMRIADALNESTSTFKAELNRIQMVLDRVKNQRNTFFLIDEMLRGTNSADKYRGSKAIIKQLITDHGVGMVATHDLQLAKLADEYPDVVKNYHFDIQVRDGDMLFDYRLKEGECTIFNASLLLKNIGITVE